MDLSLLSDEQLQQMFDMGNFAAGAELASRKNDPEKIIEETIVPTPFREFGDMKIGRDDQKIFGDSVGQRFNIENNPELFFNTAAGQAQAEDEQDFFDYLQNLSGGVVDFAKDITGRTIASQALGGAGKMIFGLPGALAGLTFGALKGGDLFNRNPVIADIAQAGNPFGLNMRRDAARISNMLQRGAAGKNFSQRNLDNVLSKFGITNIDTGGMMDSIAQSAQTGYGGYGSSDAAAAAAASGGRDYSSSPGAMAGDLEYGEE